MEKKKKQETAEEKDTSKKEVQAEEKQNTEVEELKAALAEANDRILRISAEYDNFKKRTVREKGELYAAAAGDVLGKLLPVFDNLSRAGICTDFDSLKQGVDMILTSFASSLAACGVTEIDPIGEAFDPTLHEAVMQEESEEYEENTVSLVLQKGYKVGERVLRPAMVKVAK